MKVTFLLILTPGEAGLQRGGPGSPGITQPGKWLWQTAVWGLSRLLPPSPRWGLQGGVESGCRDPILAHRVGRETRGRSPATQCTTRCPQAPAVGWPRICDSGFIKCLLMDVTRGRGEGRLQAGPHGRATCMLKWVMRDITNPQYWAKLSLNPLTIVVVSLVHHTGLCKPIWRGGRGKRGLERVFPGG